jgi:hypothetical protein
VEACGRVSFQFPFQSSPEKKEIALMIKGWILRQMVENVN